MNNFKKVSLTALGASLVATSAYAGEVTVAGGASMKVSHQNGGAANAGKSFSMGNQLTFTGGGELDNGLNVSISFILDQGDDTAVASGPFDSHSVTVSSDALGSVTMHGEGGDSAVGAIDGSAAGGLWDNTFLSTGVTGAKPKAAAFQSGGLVYTLPTLADGFSATASYSPKKSHAESSTSFAITYTGMEGLTLKYGTGEDNQTAGSFADQTAMYASYAYGPITFAYSNTEYDDVTANQDQEMTSMNVSYTVSDEISISYGSTEIEDGTANSATNLDAEVAGFTASYTAGGMTLKTQRITADNVDFSATATKDREYWNLSATFAF